MIAFLVRRLAAGVLLLAAVAASTFLLLAAAPGDTAQVLAGESGDAQYLALLRERLGLDRPLAYQIASYVRHVAGGDLGYSFVQGKSVREAIVERLPASLLLAGTAITLAALLGLTFGVVAAARGRRLDGFLSVLSLSAYSIPVFWLGQLLIALFAVHLHWLPSGGMHDAEGGGTLDLLRHLLLPAGTLSLLLLALVFRVVRASMLDALAEDHVRTARAKGLPERRVVLRHALPNALRPVVTVLTGYAGTVLTGSVLVETVFAWPGLGRLLYDSVLARDTPMLAGLLLLSALAVVVANVIADVVYRLLDPRTELR